LALPHRHGDGYLRNFVINKTSELNKNNINVFYEGYAEPGNVFPNALCVFSLQENTNYPSRVVAEALCYGCNVIATDVGDSRCFGNLEGLFYIEKFDNSFYYLIENIINSSYLNNNHEIISNSAKNKFSNKDYLNYFNSLLFEVMANDQ